MIAEMQDSSLWKNEKFPARDVTPAMYRMGKSWIAALYTHKRPLCFTPTKAFAFGGREFEGGYPTMAYSTQNFGWVVQRGPDGIRFAKV